MKQGKILLSVLIVIFIIIMWNTYRRLDVSNRLQTVTNASVEDIIKAESLSIKNEHLINASDEGIFQNTVAAGSRVFKGQTVGCLYVGNFDSQLVNSLNLVNENLREAKLSQNSQETLINDAATVDNTILSYTSLLSELGAAENQQEINHLRREIDNLLLRKKSIAEGTIGNAESQITTLESQKDSLEAQLGNTKKNLFAPSPGLFTIGCDGLESRLTLSSLSGLTIADVETLINDSPALTETPQKTAVAKVADNNKWVLAFVTDEKRAQNLKNKTDIDIRLKQEGDGLISCTLKSVSKPEDGKCLVLIAGTKEIAGIYGSRKVDVEVLVDNYSGLKVPLSAVQKDDSGDFVNVFNNNIITRKPINIIYTSGDYCIVEENNQQDGALRLYDEVIKN